MLDQYGYEQEHPATEADQRREMQSYFAQIRHTYAYFDCGCCGAFHPYGYGGDCRNDLYRIDDPDTLHGVGAWEYVEAEA